MPDEARIADAPAWAADTGNELIDWHEEDGVFVYLIRKAEE